MDRIPCFSTDVGLLVGAFEDRDFVGSGQAATSFLPLSSLRPDSGAGRKEGKKYRGFFCASRSPTFILAGNPGKRRRTILAWGHPHLLATAKIIRD